MPALFWFRNDLRLEDNAGLAAALKSGAPVLCAYILDPEDRRGAASRVWLHHALDGLAGQLKEKNIDLLLAKGDTYETLRSICRDHDIDALYVNRAYAPAQERLDTHITDNLDGVKTRIFRGNYLVEPGDVRTKTGGAYKVFTPFYNAVLDRGIDTDIDPAPYRQAHKIAAKNSLPLSGLNLLPDNNPRWDRKITPYWTIGEDGAQTLLQEFIEDKSGHYKARRDEPGVDFTSRLSPYLHFGHISPRQIWRACVKDSATRHAAFLRQLVWREFSMQLLTENPDMAREPLQKQFARFPWQKDSTFLAAWQQGKTGYPIVDAGMRQLWETGWMHNRVRLIVGSFLVKHLLQPWQDGEAWFWDTLVDADHANNSANWQWVAGCGADAAPYFRVFNAILQGEKFDPKGTYVRSWIPELADVPDKFIHKPWEYEAKPEAYPAPVIDHKAGRQRALDAYAQIK